MAKREQILEGVAPEVRAACPLTAQQVSAVYRIDYQTIIDACEMFVQSRGRRGLRAFRMGRVWRVRPSCVEEWMARLEEDQAKGMR